MESKELMREETAMKRSFVQKVVNWAPLYLVIQLVLTLASLLVIHLLHFRCIDIDSHKEWMTAAAIDQNTYSNLLSVLSNELDWPHQSGITGYVPSSQNLMAESIYKKMVQRNRCNHRDYQNIAVNGCRSGSMYSDVIKTMARNSTLDAPALVFYELIGNDVCSPHKTLDRVSHFMRLSLAQFHHADDHS